MQKILLVVALLLSVSLAQKCHPECSWKCDDPRCDAICTPVCEPPKCHSSCQEPKNAVCDVKCERPDCQIMCPEKACEMEDCPKCVTVCKSPHCVTHCQVPKPECEAVCEEPKCDWKCHKPECPKPKCELVCENPTCRPQIECCKCDANGAPLEGVMFFKETEQDPACCKCKENAMRFEEVEFSRSHQTPQGPGSHAGPKVDPLSRSNFVHAEQASGLANHPQNTDTNNLDAATYVSHESTHYSVNALPIPQRIGPSYYEKPTKLITRIEAPIL